MKLLSIAVSLIISSAIFAQDGYWQQSVTYDIKAELNDVEKSITGSETIVYKNNSQSTLTFIWFHIWPNAYKDKSTTLMKQIAADKERAKKAENFGTGSIEGLAFTVNGQPAKTEAHSNPQYIDVIKVVLNKPLAPGESVTISTPFKTMLPPYFSRSGYADGEFMACQWYPKPAVFDKSGWHEFPYLDMGEFYAEYADFNVSLTLPSTYVVGATGNLTTTLELAAYKKLGTANTKSRGKKNFKPKNYKPTVATPTKTLTYVAKNVPDFAWFADKNFAIQYDTCKLASGRVIEAFTFFHNNNKETMALWKNSIDFTEDAVRKYGNWIGEYDYPTVQVVEGPKNNSSGGMEYPMITLITSPDANSESLDAVIAHEVGHNWFMSMLGTNERDHAWMDEGFNTYYQFRYEAVKYHTMSMLGPLPDNLKALPPEQFQSILYGFVGENVPMESAMDTPSGDFSTSEEYGVVSYLKTAYWLSLLEAAVGQAKVDKAVQAYFKKWRHKHPQPEDMQAAFEEALGMDLDKFFALTKQAGKLEYKK